MKITTVDVTWESRRKERPIADALQVLDTHGVTRVTIGTDEGMTGTGEISFGRGLASPKVLAMLIEGELAPKVIGEDPFLVRKIRDDLWRETDYHGSVGLATMGIAGIDLALWDVMGKALEQPVWRLLGAARDRIPAYAMVGWLHHDLDSLVEIVETALGQGFHGIKIKVGSPTLQEDVRRIEAVQRVLESHHVLMVDANQVFTVAEALRRGRVFEEMGCFWFEEPIRADDTAGHVQLAEALDIQIATGENRFGQRQFRDLFTQGGVDVVQPDIRRAGGLTECLDIGLMANGFGIPYASHGGGPHVHVLAALPNTMYMECGLMPADGSMRLVNGCVPLPEEPGV